MEANQKIKVRNYKCFGSELMGFDNVCPINIIIGKNNSGKSSLLELIEFVSGSNKSFLKADKLGNVPEVFMTKPLIEKEIEKVFTKHTHGGGIPGPRHYDYGMHFLGKNVTFKVNNGLSYTEFEIESSTDSNVQTYWNNLNPHIQNYFKGKEYRHISAERDIVPEINNPALHLSNNGSGATNLIQQIINSNSQNSKWIESDLLKALNSIVNPDMEFTDIITQIDNNTNTWEIYLEDVRYQRVALSKMGSGIKTILIVLLNLCVIPKVGDKEADQYIFAFEELENNLHPALQRRLFFYIKQFVQKWNALCFITTHSNVVIDAFSEYKDAQIIHVENRGGISVTRAVLSHIDHKGILDDLDIKASDILQSNGIIWVEGPSDRNYINKWLSLYNEDLKEGIHYSIMYYGGKILANLTFDYEWLDSELIPMLKINRNAFVVIDRDGKRISNKLNETKLRIQKEIGDDACWITKGREIENYLSHNSIYQWLSSKISILDSTKLINDSNNKLEDNISIAYPACKIKYDKSKKSFSKEIANYLDNTDLDILDLRAQIQLLSAKIKKWNSL